MTHFCELNDIEVEALKKLMTKLENDAYFQFKWYSGGYAEAQMYNYDQEIIDVELKYGVEDTGSGGQHYTETISIDRATMKVIN